MPSDAAFEAAARQSGQDAATTDAIEMKVSSHMSRDDALKAT